MSFCFIIPPLIADHDVETAVAAHATTEKSDAGSDLFRCRSERTRDRLVPKRRQPKPTPFGKRTTR
jgi:hypothetical protein